MKVWAKIYTFMQSPLNGENRETCYVFRQSVYLASFFRPYLVKYSH